MVFVAVVVKFSGRFSALFCVNGTAKAPKSEPIFMSFSNMIVVKVKMMDIIIFFFINVPRNSVPCIGVGFTERNSVLHTTRH